jgi:glycosyltransferase involved in cell wall biosynthesis
VTDPEIPAFFRRADVVVLPYREIDQSGVLYTALAFGKALVLSDVGGFSEVGTGRLVPPGDPAALRSALGSLLTNESERKQLGEEAGRLAASRYTWDRSAALHMQLYRDLLDE